MKEENVIVISVMSKFKTFFIPHYYIKSEFMDGERYYMIYHKFMFIDEFIERWRKLKSAKIRLNELNK